MLGAAVVGALGGFLLSKERPAEYEAESRIVLSVAESFDPLDNSSFGSTPRFVANQVSIMTTPRVLERAVSRLDGEPTPGELAASLAVSASSDSDVVSVRAAASNPQDAAERANAVVVAYQDFVSDRVAEQAATAIAATTDPALVDQIRTAAAVYGDGISVVEAATPPAAPSSPQPLRDALMMAAVAAALAAGLAALLGRREEDARPFADAAQAPVLGVVPLAQRRGSAADTGNRDHALALVALDFASAERTGAVLVTGVSADSGAADVVHGLAVAAARQGRSVLVVDADPAERALSERLTSAVPRRPLQALGSAGVPLYDAVVAVPVEHQADAPQVHLALAGNDEDDGVDDSVFAASMERVAGAFELVLVAAPPVTRSPTALALLAHTGSALAVAGFSEDPALVEALRYRVESAGQELTGLVLTRGTAGRRRKVRPVKVTPPSRQLPVPDSRTDTLPGVRAR